MKVEPDFVNFAPTEELQFLRARVQELEREKAEMAEENRRLKDLLINEIPSLLTSMKQTLSVCTARVSGPDFAHAHPGADSPSFGQSVTDGSEFIHAAPACVRKPERSEFMQTIPTSAPRRPDAVPFVPAMPSGLGRDDGDGEYVVTDDDGGVVCPVVITDEDCHTCPSSACSSPDLPPARDCSELEHRRISGNDVNHVRQVEVYPGSNVFCEARAWHAAIQAPSPTAMARTLLLGVFDMDTLLHSNLRGGRSRRPTFPNHRAGLDPHKLDAIYSTLAFLALSPNTHPPVPGSVLRQPCTLSTPTSPPLFTHSPPHPAPVCFSLTHSRSCSRSHGPIHSQRRLMHTLPVSCT
ncbi:uncharacterized protein LOC133117861 isoform X2 [Conger conger]|nr:uncharacterized protein LOC133117861 isoform X2 [Conger conger]